MPELGRKAVFLIPLAVFGLLAALFVLALKGPAPNFIPSVLINKKITPFDIPGLAEDPETGEMLYRLSDQNLKEGEVTIVNFWASWCGPCRIEHPYLMALAREGKARLYGIDYKDEPDDARAFLDDMGNPFEKIGVDFSGRVGIDWGVTGVPETFVVNGEGRIIAKHTGPLTREDVDQTIMPAVEAARR